MIKPARCILFVISVSLFNLTQAQDIVDPSRQSQRLQPRPESQASTPAVEIPEASSDAAGSNNGPEQQFRLSGITLDGLTHLPDATWQEITSSYIGRDISFSDLQAMASRLSAAYRDEGYILSRAIIPPQRITDGQLRVEVVEGYIDQVKVEGADSPPLLQRHGARLEQNRPLTTNTLERELLLANDLPGVSIRSILTPSATTPGASDLTFLTEEQRFSGYLGTDNLNSSYLGDNEIIAAGYAHDLLGLSERIGVTLASAAENNPALAYGAVSYQQPLTASGLSLFTSYSYSETEPEFNDLAISTEAEAKTFLAELSYPFIRSRNLNLSGSLSFYGADIRSESELINPVFDDHVRNLSANLRLNSHDRLGGANTVELSFVQGLTALGGSDSDDANLSRSNADSDYRRMTTELTRRQSLGNGFNLLLGIAGQYAFDDDLLASEEWGLGSTFYGRAYDVAEITGEHGLAGKVELQWNTFIGNQSLQFFTFYETGKVRQESVSPGQARTDEIKSTGGGLRALLWQKANLELYVANPLNREVRAEQNRDARIFFSLNTYF